MKKLIILFVMTSVIGHGASAAPQTSQVTSVRSFTAALEANEKIQRYITGRVKASAELLVEILKFTNEVDSQSMALSEKAIETLMLADEAGSHLATLDSEVRNELGPLMASLLTKHPSGRKNTILLRIMDRFWLWSPEHLEFMARKVRSDTSHLISTQLIWILEQSTPEQRHAFFFHIPERLNPYIRWFPYALAYKYERPIDLRIMRRLLNFTSPEKLRPPPLPILLNGVILPTTATLYQETKLRLQGENQDTICSSILLGPKSSSD